MTDKQLNIINTALELFASHGYNAVSTNRIALKAGVSEGLIFRHFKNKNGLLEAIMLQAEEKLQTLISDILAEEIPEEVIKSSIHLPYKVKKSDYPFWQLQFKLKWEQEYHKPEKLKPWLIKLSWAFEQLGYESPQLEAQKLLAIIESISIQILRNELKNKTAFKNFLLKTYKLK